MLALNTNDLVISSDTNLVGLYVAQIGANGRVLAIEAHEAAPLRHEDGTVEVPFPASLLLADATDTQGVHVKLVAYRGASRTPLTMRESRTQLPNEGQRLLRLNLYFTNQDNVADSAPGTTVLAEGSSLVSASDLSFRNATGPIPQNQFDRFTSLCDGAPAPAGKTAGDDGRCVDLEVDVNTLPFREDPGALVPGANPDADSCYDVGRAFSLWEDGAIGHFDRAAIDALPTTGECRIDLPAAYDPARLNVAMSTTEAAFETRSNPHDPNSPTTTAPSLRPLPLGVAYRHEGNSIVLPAHVCAVVRRAAVQELLFSQRTVAWRGEEPVCAPWSHAKLPHEYDGAVPAPLPPGTDGGAEGGITDAGAPDGDAGTPPSFSDYGLVAETAYRIDSFAAGDGRVALGQLDFGSDAGVVVLDPARFEQWTLTPRGTALMYPLGAENMAPEVRSMNVDGQTEFYAQARDGAGLWHVGATIESIAGPWDGGSKAVVAPLWDGPAVAWTSFETTDSKLVVQRLTAPRTLAQSPFIEYPIAEFDLADGFGTSFSGTTFVVPSYGATYLRCIGASCEPVTGNAALDELDTPAHSGGATFSIARGPNLPGQRVLFQFETSAYVEQPSYSADQLVAGGGHFCFVASGEGGPQSIVCFTRSAQQPVPLLEGTRQTRLARDEQYLYATYECDPGQSQEPQTASPVFVARMPWARIGQSPNAFVNRCTAGAGPDGGDGGPGFSTADASTRADAAPNN